MVNQMAKKKIPNGLNLEQSEASTYNYSRTQIIKGLIIELTLPRKSPLALLFQRGVLFLPLTKGGEEGFYEAVFSLF